MTVGADVATVILGSESRYRRELIERLGLTVTCMASPFDEEGAKAGLSGLPIPERARALAIGKAEALGEAYPDAVIIGSDQLGEVDGEALGKPHTRERALAQLRRLAGREHRLHTAVAVHHRASGRTETAVDTTALVMRALTDEAIADYVARDAPLDCAGSYRVESLGIALFERVRGDDFTAVIGLPLTRLVELLERFGVRVLG